jgi:hypothetical protein
LSFFISDFSLEGTVSRQAAKMQSSPSKKNFELDTLFNYGASSGYDCWRFSNKALSTKY